VPDCTTVRILRFNMLYLFVCICREMRCGGTLNVPMPTSHVISDGTS